MFLKKTHAETSNKNGLDFLYFDKLVKYEKSTLNDYFTTT